MPDMGEPLYSDSVAARAHLEALRWPDGPICPHCDASGPAQSGRVTGTGARPGLRICHDCRRTFTVTVGTYLERSHVAPEIWIRAAALMAATPGGVSARRLHRDLGVAYRTAWGMVRRMRAATSGE